MANLKAGTSIGGHLVFHSGNFNNKYTAMIASQLDVADGMITLKSINAAKVSPNFTTVTTNQNYIYFGAGVGSNDPGFIMHETSDGDDANKGVLHICPSDDNSTDDYVTIHGTNDPEAIKLRTDGSAYFSGKVGILNSSPTVSLDVGGQMRASDIITSYNTSDSGRALLARSIGNGGYMFLYDKDSNLDVAFRSYGDSYFNGGNVGIGTTAPGYKLDVNGTAKATEFYAKYQNTGIHFDVVGNTETPAIKTSSAWITGGADYAGLDKLNNVAVQTWYGFSVSPTISNAAYPVAQGKPAFSVDARSGNTYVYNSIYAGSTGRSQNTVIKVSAGDTYKCGFEAFGSSQGTAYLYLGQSSSYGTGLLYNGDDNPDIPNTPDSMSFYRKYNTADYEVFYYKLTGNNVYFNDSILAVNGVGTKDNTSMGYIAHPGGAFYQTTTTSITGAIKISLPTYRQADMIRFTVGIYDYANNESLSIDIAAYVYNNGTWASETVLINTNNSNKFFTVRFGEDATKSCLWIGETSSEWAYPQISVYNFVGGYSTNIDSYLSGWNISFVTSFDTVDDTISGVDNLLPHSKYSYNSDKLDGYTSGDFYRNYNSLLSIADGDTNFHTLVRISSSAWGAQGIISIRGTVSAESYHGIIEVIADKSHAPNIRISNGSFSTFEIKGEWGDDNKLYIYFRRTATSTGKGTLSLYFVAIELGGTIEVTTTGATNPTLTKVLLASAGLQLFSNSVQSNTYFYSKSATDSSKSTLGYATGSGGFLWLYDNSGAVKTVIRGYGDSYFNTSGNVGIGTTAPSEKLHVVGNIYGINVIGSTSLECSQTSGTDPLSGICLYSTGNAYSYGIQDIKTSTPGYGTYGDVTGDWATYFNMHNYTANRGWIFRTGQSSTTAGTNVASISTNGKLTTKSGITANGAIYGQSNRTDISRVLTETDLKWGYDDSYIRLNITGSGTNDRWYKIASWTKTGDYQSNTLVLHVVSRSEGQYVTDYYMKFGFETVTGTSGNIGNTYLVQYGNYYRSDYWAYYKDGSTVTLYYRYAGDWRTNYGKVIQTYGGLPNWIADGTYVTTLPTGSVESDKNVLTYNPAKINSTLSLTDNLYIGTGKALFFDGSVYYIRSATGTYGSVAVYGQKSGYSGYSIQGRAVFMHNGSATTGIYDDVNNLWMIQTVHAGGVKLYYNGSSKLETTTDGITVTGTGTATDWIATSDRRLKENIKYLPSQLNDVIKVGKLAVKYQLKEDNTKRERIGFVAQELEEIYPEFVFESDDEEKTKAIDYAKMVAPLYNAISELNDKIEKQQEIIEKQQKIIDELLSKI